MGLFQRDAGVDYLIENITDKVHDYDQDSKNDRCAHDQRVVAVDNAADKGASDSGNCKNLFDYKRTGYDVSKHRSKIGDNGDERVFERVSEDYFICRNALSLCGTDVILTEYVEH